MTFDNDDEASSCITPKSKRSFEEFEDMTTSSLPSTECSTNKAQRRVVVKEEKD